MSRHLRSITVSLHVRDIDTNAGRTRRAIISQVQSDMGSLYTSELALLMHALAAPVTTEQQAARRGFPYTLGRFFLS